MSRSGNGMRPRSGPGLISGRLPDANRRAGMVNIAAGGSTALAPSHGMGKAATRGRNARKAERPVGDMAVPSALLVARDNGYGVADRESGSVARGLAPLPGDVAALVMVGGPQLVRARSRGGFAGFHW